MGLLPSCCRLQPLQLHVAGPVQGAGPRAICPALPLPWELQGLPDWREPSLFLLPIFPPPSSQLLYLKLILNFLFEETK